MKNLRKHWPVLTGIVGVVLIAVGVSAAYWWYYRAAPYRKICDPNWCRQHSALAHWEAFRSRYDRHDWPHDAFSICIPGDKDFMATLVSRIEPEDEIRACDFGHLDRLFPYITNQDAGQTAGAWLAWWKTNQTKSQVDWIRDGFAARGLSVSTQLQDAVIVPLLDLMGNTDTNKVSRIPTFLNYNAFRWLRDSGFEPVPYAVSNLTARTAAQTKRGLITYANWESIYPRRNGVGILAFGQGKDRWLGWSIPVMFEKRFLAAIYSLIYGVPLLGLALLAVSIRKKRKQSNNGPDPIR
jgi:hypothetical protein